jgi:hypothetical protein
MNISHPKAIPQIMAKTLTQRGTERITANLKLGRSTIQTRSQIAAKWIVIFIGGIFFASIISPQLSVLADDLRFRIPTYLILCVFIILIRRDRILFQIRDFILPGIFILIFIATGELRQLFDPNDAFLGNYILSALFILRLWVAVFLIRKVFPESIEGIRWVILIALGISFGAGIPTLFQIPQIARQTMIAAQFAPPLFMKGVGSYTFYLPVGFAFPAIATWLYNTKQGWLMKLAGWGALITASVAVLFSTFTMAIVMLLLGALTWLFFVIISAKGKLIRFISAAILIVVAIAFPTIYLIGQNINATSFSTEKVVRIITNSLSSGFIQGDDTGRVLRIVDTLPTIINHPIFGAWGFGGNYYIGQHSSWVDTYAVFGIFIFLYLGFLFPYLKRGPKPLSVSRGTAGGTISWILWAAGGVLDPTFFIQNGFVLLWLFDDGGIWQKNNNTKK